MCVYFYFYLLLFALILLCHLLCCVVWWAQKIIVISSRTLPNNNLLLVRLQTETTQKETKVRLKTIRVDTNLSKLAKDIVNKSKYISEKKLPLVEQLVYDLQQRQFQDDDMDFEQQKNEMEAPTMDKIDEYMEMLYGGEDEIQEKIKGCTKILQLCRYVGNLEVLIQNMQLMSALSRVLNDDFKRSMELSYKLCSIFLALSNFMEMHTILSNYR